MGLQKLRVIGIVLAAALLCLPLESRSAPPTQSDLAAVSIAQLPVEARDTLRVIKQGGPFAFPRDGAVFNNFEKVLPERQRGYYHEYTVITPGVNNRGVRRLISGVPDEYYYTDDHYQTFKRIRE